MFNKKMFNEKMFEGGNKKKQTIGAGDASMFRSKQIRLFSSKK